MEVGWAQRPEADWRPTPRPPLHEETRAGAGPDHTPNPHPCPQAHSAPAPPPSSPAARPPPRPPASGTCQHAHGPVDGVQVPAHQHLHEQAEELGPGFRPVPVGDGRHGVGHAGAHLAYRLPQPAGQQLPDDRLRLRRREARLPSGRPARGWQGPARRAHRQRRVPGTPSLSRLRHAHLAAPPPAPQWHSGTGHCVQSITMRLNENLVWQPRGHTVL